MGLVIVVWDTLWTVFALMYGLGRDVLGGEQTHSYDTRSVNDKVHLEECNDARGSAKNIL